MQLYLDCFDDQAFKPWRPAFKEHLQVMGAFPTTLSLQCLANCLICLWSLKRILENLVYHPNQGDHRLAALPDSVQASLSLHVLLAL